MRLNYAQIENYRSIREVRIKFEPRCRVLVGMNESGKTNILRALALLDPKRKPDASDLREFAPDEKLDQEASVYFAFQLEAHEVLQLSKKVEARFLGKADSLLSLDGKSYSFSEFCARRNEGLYNINIRTGEKKGKYWVVPKQWSLGQPWVKPVKGATFQVNVQGKPTPISQFTLIDIASHSKIPPDQIEMADAAYVGQLFGVEVAAFISQNLPSVLFWDYNESNLLPGRIPLAAFIDDPDSCIPLKHMFELAGIREISETLAKAEERSNAMRNLLDRVAKRTTKHMRAVWKELRDLTIDLRHQGEFIEAGVSDAHNIYTLDRRSDGFKRFVTFLLMVSARSKTKDMRDVLYLQDEPDTSLHPSGARYLRDELLEIAQGNYLVFSTHSMFMIDRENIGRHLIVTRKGEITRIDEVDDSNIKDEEVLFNAVGTSIFEDLAERNLLFEGWRDKTMFRSALKSLPPEQRKLGDELAKWGCCHAQGVKNVSAIAAVLELANRKAIIISDGDQAARQHQQAYDGDFKWIRYDDLVPNLGIVTAEDFVEPSFFLRIAERYVKERIPAVDINELRTTCAGGNRLERLGQLFMKSGLTKEESKSFLNDLKTAFVEGFTGKAIDPAYFAMLTALSKEVV